MFRMAPPAALVLSTLAMLLAGCYGSTDPASNIGIDRATLNGNGTTNHGTAHVFFQFWPTAQPQNVVSTPGRDIGGGATGPFSETTASYPEPIGGQLSYATQYSYRLCGQDRGAAQLVCAQTVTFKTAGPAGDVVRGSFSERIGAYVGQVDAHGDASGAHPGGSLSLPSESSGGTEFSGTVTCVTVNGTRGAVGAVGTQSGHPTTALFEADTAGGGPAKIGFYLTPGSTPPNCLTAPFTNLFTPLGPDYIRVYDAP